MTLHITARRPLRHAGLTLVELLVALALGTLIAIAAVSALIVARQGFRSVDTNAQLRENARFAASLIQRVVVQAGFENAAYGLYTDPKDPGLDGFDNAMIGNYSHASNAPAMVTDSRSSCTQTDTSCANGSDILVVRYFGASRAGAATGDGSIINCAGQTEAEGAERAFSIFHVVRSAAGEPTLACTYRNGTAWATVPLVTGVEGFQVLYGVDTQNGATAAATPQLGDTIADTYLTARQLENTPSGSRIDNWRRVRTVRIGLLIRGPVPETLVSAAAASTPVLGSQFANSTDIGSSLNLPADGRLRQRLVFTVHLRNAQYAYSS